MRELLLNHLWYWGDQHYEITVGPERARQQTRICSEAGVPRAVLNDAGVPPWLAAYDVVRSESDDPIRPHPWRGRKLVRFRDSKP